MPLRLKDELAPLLRPYDATLAQSLTPPDTVRDFTPIVRHTQLKRKLPVSQF